MGCGHMIMVPRKLVEKNVRGMKGADGVENGKKPRKCRKIVGKQEKVLAFSCQFLIKY